MIGQPVRWTPAMDQLIVDQFSTVGCSEVARQLNLSHSSVSRRAAHLRVGGPKRRVTPNSWAAQMLALAQQPGGLRRKALPECVDNRFYGLVRSLVESGLLFKGATSVHNARWFSTAEAAAQWEHSERNKPMLAPVAKAPRPSVRVPYSGGPARLPGEPVCTERTKFTIAPPPPTVLYRTNTYPPG